MKPPSLPEAFPSSLLFTPLLDSLSFLPNFCRKITRAFLFQTPDITCLPEKSPSLSLMAGTPSILLPTAQTPVPASSGCVAGMAMSHCAAAIFFFTMATCHCSSSTSCSILLRNSAAFRGHPGTASATSPGNPDPPSLSLPPGTSSPVPLLNSSSIPSSLLLTSNVIEVN